MTPDPVGRAAAALYAAGAAHVWVFGSRAGGRKTDRLSDVDLAVDGLAAGAMQSAVDDARVAVGGRVDVIAIESAPPSLRAMVARSRELIPRDGAGESPDVDSPRGLPRMIQSLAQARVDATMRVLRTSGARRVIDLGCGFGRLIEALARTGQFGAMTGVDRSERALDVASRRLRNVLSVDQRSGVSLVHDLVTYRSAEFVGYDAAVAMELIEHLPDQPRLAFARVLFDHIDATVIAVTTPNRDYNALFGIAEGDRRLIAHRFEWSRAEFADWAGECGAEFGYAVAMRGIGPTDPQLGSPSQMAVFRR